MSTNQIIAVQFNIDDLAFIAHCLERWAAILRLESMAQEDKGDKPYSDELYRKSVLADHIAKSIADAGKDGGSHEPLT